MLPNHIGTSTRRIKTSPTRREALGHPDFVMTLGRDDKPRAATVRRAMACIELRDPRGERGVHRADGAQRRPPNPTQGDLKCISDSSRP